MISAILATVVLAVPVHDVPNQSPAGQVPAAPVVSASDSTDGDQDQVERTRRQAGERPHTIGLGGQLAISNRGAGASTRFFLGERLGFNINALWYRNSYRYTTSQGTERGSTFATFPSFILMLTKPDLTKDVDIRPYVGAGVSYVSTSRPRVIVPGAAPTLQRFGGTGGQVFGGIEMTFREADWITISAEGIYYKVPVNIVSSALVGGFNYLMAIHFYLK